MISSSGNGGGSSSRSSHDYNGVLEEIVDACNAHKDWTGKMMVRLNQRYDRKTGILGGRRSR